MAKIPYNLIMRVKRRDKECCVLCGNPESWVKVIDDSKPLTVSNLVTVCDKCWKDRNSEEIHRYMKACYKGVK